MSVYKPRIVDAMLAARLRRKGAILIEGPKFEHPAPRRRIFDLHIYNRET